MIKTKIDHYSFYYYIFFLDIKYHYIEYQISQNTQTRQDSIDKIVITLQYITDKIVD